MNCHLRLRRHDWQPGKVVLEKVLSEMSEGWIKDFATKMAADANFEGAELCSRCGKVRR